jgi:hypothetical protein
MPDSGIRWNERGAKMPIARVMNMPDGSTPAPALGGGDVNGTLAVSIVSPGSGTAANPLAVPRHQKLQTSPLGIPNTPPTRMIVGTAGQVETENA